MMVARRNDVANVRTRLLCFRYVSKYEAAIIIGNFVVPAPLDYRISDRNVVCERERCIDAERRVAFYILICRFSDFVE